MFRTAQEALRNVVAHSHATRVDVRVSVEGRRVGLGIVDDGIGFSPERADEAREDGHFGLRVLNDMAHARRREPRASTRRRAPARASNWRCPSHDPRSARRGPRRRPRRARAAARERRRHRGGGRGRRRRRRPSRWRAEHVPDVDPDGPVDAGDGRHRGDAPDPRRPTRSARVVVLTSLTDRPRILGALDAGAMGYLLKDAEPAELFRGVRAAAQGDAPIDPRAARELLSDRTADRADARPHRPRARRAHARRHGPAEQADRRAGSASARRRSRRT